MPRHYTHDNDQQIADLYGQGLTTYEIADRLGVSPHPVADALKRQGVELRRAGKRTTWTGSAEQQAEVVAAYLAGESIRPMARRLQVNALRIIETLDAAGVTRRHQGSQPMLDEATVDQIVAGYNDGATLVELAKRHGISNHVTIRNYLVRRGVQLREPGVSRFWTDERKAETKRRYEAGESQQQIAGAFACSQGSVSDVLRQLGVITRRAMPRGSAHASWKGGRTIDRNGYARVKIPDDDPMVSMRHSNGYVPEHRLVMARMLGRPLLPDEEPHHKNTIRTDNSPGNLELWLTSQSQPRGGRVEDLLAWAVGLISRYAPEMLACADCGSHNVEAVPLD